MGGTFTHNGRSLPAIKRKLGNGQMPEAGSQICPQRSRLRGGRGSVDERTDRVDLLADRVAAVVKAEVNRFFKGVGTELN